ncbi:MAG: hypothetical protein IJX26_01510 [Clostridia bacterium]|nr:hypothetical protein [Clostridia bacterium]
MIEIKKYKNINRLEQVWNKLSSSNSNLVPMAKFNFVKTFYNNLISKLMGLIKKNRTPVYYEVIEDSETKLILPCVIEKNQLSSLYTLDYYDCIFNENISAEKLIEYLESIVKFEGKKIVLKLLKDDGATFVKLKDLVEFESYNECVKINFSNSYEDYYSSLSKSARQNLRTAYNRANTDNLKFDFHIHFGKADKKTQKQLNKIYLNRRASRYHNMSGLKKFLFKISDRIADTCFSLDNSFYSCFDFFHFFLLLLDCN